jgi:hypothetical protein
MATKEEELQKKREEAERKARRGEIDPTHEFTFQVIRHHTMVKFTNILHAAFSYESFVRSFFELTF